MHHALEIQEILSVIFSHFSPPDPLNIHHWLPEYSSVSDLPAVVRTCRAFKEPGLDVLWGALESLSPLVRCLPGTYSQPFPGIVRWPPSICYVLLMNILPPFFCIPWSSMNL